jgi:hypothetical protein
MFASQVPLQRFWHICKAASILNCRGGGAEQGPGAHAAVVHEGLQWRPESVRLRPQDRHLYLYTYLAWRGRSFSKVSAAMRVVGLGAVRGILQSC